MSGWLVTPEALLSQLRATRDPEEKRALVEAILDLGFPWALQLDAEDLALVRRQRPVRSGRVWLAVAIGVGAFSSWLGSGTLAAVVTDDHRRAAAHQRSAQDALVELNASRVARSVSTIEALLREGQRPSAREAALHCLVIDHPAASRCAELYTATLEGFEAARAQARVRDAADVRAEMVAFLAGANAWWDEPEALDAASCATMMRDLRWLRVRSQSVAPPFMACLMGPCAGRVEAQPRSRGTGLPTCATEVLAARLDESEHGQDGWDLHAALVWQDAMERATLRAVEHARSAHEQRRFDFRSFAY